MVIVDAEKNKNATWVTSDIQTTTVDGKKYYILNKEGTYNGVQEVDKLRIL